MSSDTPIIAFELEKIETIINEMNSDVFKSIELLKDHLLTSQFHSSETTYQLCELIASSRMVSATLLSLVREENMLKEGYYVVDQIIMEALTSSVSLIKMLKAELSLKGLSLEDQ